MKNKVIKIKPTKRTISFDGISFRQKARVVQQQAEKKRVVQFEFLAFSKKLFVGRQLTAVLTMMLLFAGFLTGFWFTWQTRETGAEAQVLGVMDTASVEQSTAGTSTVARLSDDAFYKLTVSQIEAYLNEAVKTLQVKEAEQLADRKIKLKAYLEDRGSPFVEISDSIAELPHWKMVLAISNSESTMGKNCYNNNCSGIGVAPGHPLWREYASTKDWAKDLNKLLEKRYKDWTLEEMNGVYNQPGSRNWVRASKQVLEELQEREIN